MSSAAESVVASRTLGWRAGSYPAAFGAGQIAARLQHVREPVHIVSSGPGGPMGLALGGEVTAADAADCLLLGTLPSLYPEWLGDRAFCETHGVRFPYVAGEMARGIATTRMVISMARAEMLSIFGAAGLDLESIEQAVDELIGVLGRRCAWGVNLIYSPAEPVLEERTAELLLRRGVRAASAKPLLTVGRCRVSPGPVTSSSPRASQLTDQRAGQLRSRRMHEQARSPYCDLSS
jgi:trans-AT polyketide synthase/acyltransferase/oxidoreductase domain-containing protein